MFKIILTIAFLLNCRFTGQSSDRCDSICQNDERCKSGQCILTYCSESVACYKFCLLCEQNLQCFQTGDHCYYANRSSINYYYKKTMIKLWITFTVIIIKLNLFEF